MPAHTLTSPRASAGRRVEPSPGGRRGVVRLRAAAAWVVTLAVVALLWPGAWGGLLGLTLVQGRSMEPTYFTGDLVVTLRQPAYRVGDVVSFEVPDGQAGAGGRAIHRISAVETNASGEAYVTLGDNNAQPDPWLIPPDHVMGRAIAQVPGLGGIMGSSTQRTIIAAAAAFLVFAFLWPTTAASPARRAGEPRSDETSTDDAQANDTQGE